MNFQTTPPLAEANTFTITAVTKRHVLTGSQLVKFIGLGIAILVVRAQVLTQAFNRQASCDIAFSTWMLVEGVLLLLVPFLAMLKNCLATQYKDIARVVDGLAHLAVVALLGVQIWGTVMAFSEDRWPAHLDANTMDAACPNFIYVPFAVLVICAWVST